MPKKGRCKVKGCNRPASTRGVCSRHYQMIRRYREQAGLTWQAIEDAGLVDPAYKNNDPAVVALDAIASKLGGVEAPAGSRQ